MMAVNRNNPELAGGSSLGAGLNAVMRMLHYIFLLLSFGIVLVLIWYFSFGGAFTVEERERVLVMQFGELANKVYEPGWHWDWPYPICEIVRVPVSRQTATTDAFWFYVDPNAMDPDAPPNTVLVPGKGGYLFTGDTNIFHVGWGMFYHVSDPRKYYLKCMGPADPRQGDALLNDRHMAFSTRGPQTLIKALFENAIIEATTKLTIDDVLSPEYRKNIENAVKVAIGKEDIGVTVDEVWFSKPRTPPEAASEAFRAVFDANNFSFSERERSKSYATRMLNEAESQSVKVIADAQAYRTRVVASIKADTKYFKAMLEEYRKNPDIVLVARYTEVLGEVLNLADDKFVIRTNPNGNQEIRLLLNREPIVKSEKPEDNEEGQK